MFLDVGSNNFIRMLCLNTIICEPSDALAAIFATLSCFFCIVGMSKVTQANAGGDVQMSDACVRRLLALLKCHNNKIPSLQHYCF